MKKTFYLLAIVLILIACNNNKNNTQSGESSIRPTQSYLGLYKGIYPCADCSRIEVSLILNEDKTFVYETVYWDKKDGRFINKGNYTIKDSILTIQEDSMPIHFVLGTNTLNFLGKDLKPAKGEFADYYKLKKQMEFAYQGNYESYSEDKESYKQTLSITQKGDSYEVLFSASEINGKENCHLSSIASVKNDTIWVDISNVENKKVLMYIAPSHDNLGVEVFTKKFDERFTMMYYCGRGGGSLAGKYFKSSITANSIGIFSKNTTIAEVLQTLPNAQINKKVGHGEFVDDIYDDYQIYTHNNQLLFTLTPKDTANIKQKINRVLINSPFFKTAKGINKNSTYGDIKKAYTITRIEPTREHIVLYIDEINMSFSIKKSILQKNWWNEKTKTVNENKIPLNAKTDDCILWWNNK